MRSLPRNVGRVSYKVFLQDLIPWTATRLLSNSSGTARRPQASAALTLSGPKRASETYKTVRPDRQHAQGKNFTLNRSPCRVLARERRPAKPASGASAGHLITGGPRGAARGASHAPAQSARRPREQARPRRCASADRRARGRRPRRRPRLSPARVLHEPQGLAPRASRIPGRRRRHSGELVEGRAGTVGPRLPLGSGGPDLGRRVSRAASRHPPDGVPPPWAAEADPSVLPPGPCLPFISLGAHLPTQLPAACATASARVLGPRTRQTPSQLRSAEQPNCGPRPRGVRTNRWAVPHCRWVSIGQGGRGGRCPGQTVARRGSP